MDSRQLLLRDSEDVERFFLDTTGMRPDYLQLSRGRAQLGLEVVDLAGVTLIWSVPTGRTRWRDTMAGDGLHFGFCLASAGPVMARGRALGADAAQVWIPGAEMDYVIDGPTRTLEIGVAAGIVEELGWMIDGDPLATVPREVLQRLARTCALVAAATGASPSGSDRDRAGPVTRGREAVLEALEAALHPWMVGSEEKARGLLGGSSSYLLVRRADPLLDALAHDAPLEVDELAASLDVPRRTLFHAYRTVLGLGPRAYFELKRLHQLRARLKRAAPGEATVTAIATELGFGDLGRLAARYRRQFGETPSKTLARQDGAIVIARSTNQSVATVPAT